MIRLVSFVPLLVATSVHAQAVAEEQMETASPIAIWLFAVLFFGGCAWYAWLTWRKEKKDRESKAQSERKTVAS